MVGVSATGMTACPCAQELVAARARDRLAEDGFSEEQIERVLERVPVATHNQRGLATLHIGCLEECDAEIDGTALLAIAEASMSSEIYELMKRSDEVEVVEKAHRRPRFVEDCVREMVAGVVAEFPELDDRTSSRAPGEPRDDPPAQRRRRTPRPASQSCARRSSSGDAGAPSDDAARTWLGRRRGRRVAARAERDAQGRGCAARRRRRPKK